MPRKKRKSVVDRVRSLEECRDTYEKAMLCGEEDDWSGFESNMTIALVETTRLLDNQKKAAADKADIAESREFLGDCCYELGSFYLEQDETYQAEGPSQASARKAAPHLRLALKFGEDEDKVTAAYYKPAVIALSESYTTLHQHDLDIELCRGTIAKMVARYNADTPLQNDILVALAQAFNRLNRLSEAEETYRRIVTICKENFGADSEQTRESEEDLQEYLESKVAKICDCQNQGNP